MATVQTLTLAGQRFVVVPEAEYRRLAGKARSPAAAPDADGNYPAVETMRAMLARKIIRRRRAARAFPGRDWPAGLVSGPKPSIGWNRADTPLVWPQWTSWIGR